MKRLAVLLAAAMLTLSLSGLTFGEEAKPAAKKDAAVETKADDGKEAKDATKGKKKEAKPKKAKKKEAAGC